MNLGWFLSEWIVISDEHQITFFFLSPLINVFFMQLSLICNEFVLIKVY